MARLARLVVSDVIPNTPTESLYLWYGILITKIKNYKIAVLNHKLHNAYVSNSFASNKK